MTYNEVCIKKFMELPSAMRDMVWSAEMLEKADKIEKQYKIDIGFLVILVFINELQVDDIVEYLEKKFQLAKNVAEKLFNDLMGDIIDPVLINVDVSNEEFDVNKEKQKILEMFNKNLVDYLVDLDDRLLNKKIIYFLGLDEKNKYQLERLLLVSQEKIAHLTIADWLKDFISQKGSAMFNDITLTDYIAHSPNCQKLNVENRRLVRKLLILYRNLKFFPESMPNGTGEDWEIIPIDDKVRDFNRGALGAPRTAEEKNIDVLQAESRGYGADSLEKKVIDEEISNEKKIEGLRIMANRYPEGSLEWRALMDEVRKMN